MTLISHKWRERMLRASTLREKAKKEIPLSSTSLRRDVTASRPLQAKPRSSSASSSSPVPLHQHTTSKPAPPAALYTNMLYRVPHSFHIEAELDGAT